MTNRSLFRAIGKECRGMPAYVAKQVIQAYVRVLRRELKSGGRVTLYGMGTFQVKERAGKMIQHVTSGEWIQIPDDRKISFKPSPSFKKII